MIQIDIDMPEKCGLCPLFHAEHPMYCQGVKADSKKKIVAPYGQPKPNWCLLHEVTADTDTVSRQAAIDALEKIPVREFKKTDGLLDALVSVGQVYMALKQLPSAQQDCTECEEYDHKTKSCPYYCEVIRKTADELQVEASCKLPERKTGRWIPCSERLPEEDHWLGGSGKQFSDNVLISIVNRDDEDAWVQVSQTID